MSTRARTVIPPDRRLSPTTLARGSTRCRNPAQTPRGAGAVGQTPPLRLARLPHPMTSSRPALADALLSSLRVLLTVSFQPLDLVVARLDTTSTPWVLYLDSGSPVQDQCWAMIDVLRVLTIGVPSAESAVHAPLLRLVRSRPAGTAS